MTIVATIDGLGIQFYFDRTIDPHRITETFGDMLFQNLATEKA